MSRARAAKAATATSAPRVIAVASGKGGVGKTNLVANLACAFADSGRRVLAMDADLGLSNLDLCLGVATDFSLLDVVDGDMDISEVLVDGPAGVTLLPGLSGSYDLATIDEQGRYAMFEAIDTLENSFDVLLLDTGAGIGSNAIGFAAAAQTVVIVATPDPTSLADAYAFIKVAAGQRQVKRFELVSSMCASAAEGEAVYERLSNMVNRFLNVSFDYLGCILRDGAVNRGVRAGVPHIVAEPKALASQCVVRVANKILAIPAEASSAAGIGLFWKRLVGWKEAS